MVATSVFYCSTIIFSVPYVAGCINAVNSVGLPSGGEDVGAETPKEPGDDGKRLSGGHLQKQISRQASSDRGGRRRTLGHALAPGLPLITRSHMEIISNASRRCRMLIMFGSSVNKIQEVISTASQVLRDRQDVCISTISALV